MLRLVSSRIVRLQTRIENAIFHSLAALGETFGQALRHPLQSNLNSLLQGLRGRLKMSALVHMDVQMLLIPSLEAEVFVFLVVMASGVILSQLDPASLSNL